MSYLCWIFTSPLANVLLNRLMGSSRSAWWSNKESNSARYNVTGLVWLGFSKKTSLTCNKVVRQSSDLLFIATSFWFEETVRTNTAGLGRLCTLFVCSTLLVFEHTHAVLSSTLVLCCTMVTTSTAAMSNSRYADTDRMKNIFLIRFSKPHLDRTKAGRWANACRLEGSTIASIKKDTYMCSLNFIGNIVFTLNHVRCARQFIYSSWLSIHGKMVYICIRIQHVGVVCKLHYFFIFMLFGK